MDPVLIGDKLYSYVPMSKGGPGPVTIILFLR